MLISKCTDKQVRDLAFEYTPYAAEEAWAEEVAQSEPVPPAADESSIPVGTDPTIAHAGLTELDTTIEPTSNGVPDPVDGPNVPDASSIDAGAANAAAETSWDVKLSGSGASAGDDWVEVAPRDLAETDTGSAATPAAITNTQSWAEESEQMPPPAYTQTPANGGDGFHEVHHNRGGRGRGGPQGENRGSNRGGRGFRGGDGPGRGRGGHRGDRGGGGGRGRGGFRGSRGRVEGAQ